MSCAKIIVKESEEQREEFVLSDPPKEEAPLHRNLRLTPRMIKYPSNQVICSQKEILDLT